MAVNEIALNMCGYNSSNDFVTSDEWKNYERIYIGHEYCSTFLVAFEKQLTSILAVINKEMRITMVFPVMQEKHWHAMENICSIIKEDQRVDEIVVNDFGTLDYCASKCIAKQLILGKLFNKSSREARVNLWEFEDIENKELLSESIFETIAFESLMEKYNIDRVETELISEKYYKTLKSNSIHKMDIHYPFIYITSGTICPLNCSNSNSGVQFENKNTCPGMCKDTLIEICNPVFGTKVINRGNTYMYKTDYVIEEDASTENIMKQYRIVNNYRYGERK